MSISIAIVSLAKALFWLPQPTVNLFDSKLASL
jgi:hypothetical protein